MAKLCRSPTWGSRIWLKNSGAGELWETLETDLTSGSTWFNWLMSLMSKLTSFEPSNKVAAIPGPNRVKAAFVGANRVNGPTPETKEHYLSLPANQQMHKLTALQAFKNEVQVGDPHRTVPQAIPCLQSHRMAQFLSEGQDRKISHSRQNSRNWSVLSKTLELSQSKTAQNPPTTWITSITCRKMRQYE